MAKPALLVTRRLPEAVEARAARDWDARLNPDDHIVRGEDIPALAEGCAAVLCCPADRLDADVIRRLPASVRALGTFSVGYDHVALDACRERGLPVVHTPDVLSLATAECALLLILMAARRAGEGERLVRSGGWTGWAPTQLLGMGVAGKRLGIFGMGRIGRELARLARGIGMQIHYRDIAPLPPDLEGAATYHADDASFLAVCDVLSLNAPGGEGTRFWLNRERLAMLPRGAVIANAARGTLVDDAALIEALRSGHVAAAGLDVYNGEPRPDPGYFGLENVVLLPHLGSNTVETRDAMGFLVLDGLDALIAGRTPGNVVA